MGKKSKRGKSKKGKKSKKKGKKGKKKDETPVVLEPPPPVLNSL